MGERLNIPTLSMSNADTAIDTSKLFPHLEDHPLITELQKAGDMDHRQEISRTLKQWEDYLKNQGAAWVAFPELLPVERKSIQEEVRRQFGPFGVWRSTTPDWDEKLLLILNANPNRLTANTCRRTRDATRYNGSYCIRTEDADETYSHRLTAAEMEDLWSRVYPGTLQQRQRTQFLNALEQQEQAEPAAKAARLALLRRIR
jgi:hypothetical protein